MNNFEKMKKLLNGIPGFRTNKLWKKIIAVVTYLTLGLTIFSLSGDGPTLRDRAIIFGQYLFVIISIITLITNSYGVKKKLPLFKKRKLLSSLMGWFLSFVMIGICVAVTSKLHTPVYKAELKAEAELQAKEKAKEDAELAKKEELDKNKDQSSDDKKEASDKKENSETKDNESSDKIVQNNASNETSSFKSGGLEVHFIDVGQADSIFIRQGSESMLIDAGNNEDGTLVKNYLKNQGVSYLSYVIGTHPHEDHIGGLDNIINSFSIGKIYMPTAQTTTKTFEDVLTAVSNKGMKISSPAVGGIFNLGSAVFKVISPGDRDYSDLNNSSIAVQIYYGNTSFLFTGDAEGEAEGDMIASGTNLNATLLKIGHHGSDSSSTQAFLDAVNPKFAVVSSGKGNSYGHPNQSVLDRLKAKNIPVYRTDESGTIIVKSDGKTLSFNVSEGSYVGADSGSVNSNTANGNTSNDNIVNNTANSSTSSNASNNNAANNSTSNNSSSSGGGSSANNIIENKPASSGSGNTSSNTNSNSGGNTSSKPNSSGTASTGNDSSASNSSSSSGSNSAGSGSSGESSGGSSVGSSSSNGSSGGTVTPPNPSHDTSRTVYYVSGGDSYHFTNGCPRLSRSKNILSGILQDVINLGKSDPCNSCT